MLLFKSPPADNADGSCYQPGSPAPGFPAPGCPRCLRPSLHFPDERQQPPWGWFRLALQQGFY